ncbi:hypothetical protein N656DRAFT_73430 [Canariomyces notabilis]|uniref:Uncharacterized protein n=1 Tax=Canariomyces notabilis TaxID=2074819 RepID=A0AAN6TE57_9PEZI|nr:hypothetical protein N656DRAFT_73430 [Canariomyces arenarius]
MLRECPRRLGQSDREQHGDSGSLLLGPASFASRFRWIVIRTVIMAGDGRASYFRSQGSVSGAHRRAGDLNSQNPRKDDLFAPGCRSQVLLHLSSNSNHLADQPCRCA